ncbi:hypothetical protein AWN76_015220 [Rhodothermaceae bacterium RA]|nr:hypothetical protein AWN76_015220 [Rhodothermaceae bacterium RA]
MHRQDWERLTRLFDEAAALPPDARPAFLARACPDEALRGELAALLAAHDRADDVLRPIERLTEASAGGSFAPGEQVGPYRLLDEIGRGGMGVVYRAEDTRLGRLVALKVLPPHLHAAIALRERFVNEARAVSALDHPNLCTLYEIGTHAGRLYLAMAYYEGETLQEKLARGPLPVPEALALARQMAEGLAAAHERGILHRDVKPANMIVTSGGCVKLLDFGLAKIAEVTQQLTAEGMTPGTAAYMSPERTRGEPADARADVWSFGVVLYEMLTGERPFPGDTAEVLFHAIRHDAPSPLTTRRPDVPGALAALVERLLAKDPAGRPASMREVARALAAFQADGDRRPRRRRAAILALGLLLLAAAAFFPYWQRVQADRARALLPEIERLAAAGAFAEAYALAERAGRHLGDDPALARLWPGITDVLTVASDPPGARVTVQRFDPGGAAQPVEVLGVTPLDGRRLPRGAYRLRLEKAGYAPHERVVSRFLFAPVIHVEHRLIPADSVPRGMVFVPGGRYRLRGWDVPDATPVDLGDYFIDRYEVSNRAFKAFIEAGGYRDTTYWRFPFVKDGRHLGRDEALAHFVDRTGLPGPRGWQNQTYPPGTADHPVTGVSWYEAAAYAAWAGKRLPTVHEWQRAARPDTTHPYGVVMPWGAMLPRENVARRANFNGHATVPVDTHPFGISPFGAYHMAGNAREWCANPMGSGFVAAGGAWEDPPYAFAYLGAFDGFYAASSLGFRCARSADPSAAPPVRPLPTNPPAPAYTPVDAATFEGFRTHYRYDPRPLDAEVVDVHESPDWRRETVTFTGAAGERLIAYLYLPRHTLPPYQTIVFSPPYPIYAGWYSIAEEVERSLAAHIRAGRAVLAVVPFGGLERPAPPDARFPDPRTVSYRNRAVQWALEHRRGLDYLATRDDIDSDRLAHLSFSAGGAKLLQPALEPRYRAILLTGAGLHPGDTLKVPEANPVHFLPRYAAPTLVLHGRYDEMDHLEVHVRPLMALLPEPKRLVVVESGHVPPADLRVPVIEAWLAETLGPVRR